MYGRIPEQKCHAVHHVLLVRAGATAGWQYMHNVPILFMPMCTVVSSLNSQHSASRSTLSGSELQQVAEMMVRPHAYAQTISSREQLHLAHSTQ